MHIAYADEKLGTFGLIHLREAITLLGLPKKKVLSLIKHGVLEAVQQGKGIFLKRQSLWDYLQGLPPVSEQKVNLALGLDKRDSNRRWKTRLNKVLPELPRKQVPIDRPHPNGDLLLGDGGIVQPMKRRPTVAPSKPYSPIIITRTSEAS